MNDPDHATNKLNSSASELLRNSVSCGDDRDHHEDSTTAEPKVNRGRTPVATPERVAAAMTQLMQEGKTLSKRAVMRITGGAFATVSREFVNAEIAKGLLVAPPIVPDSLAKQWKTSLEEHTQEIRREANQRINDLLGQLEELQSALEERDAQLNEQQQVASEATSQRDELRGRLTGECEAHERTRQDLQTCRQKQSAAETAQASLETERDLLYSTVQELEQRNESLTRQIQDLQKRHEERGIELVKVQALLDRRLSPSATTPPAAPFVAARTPQPNAADVHDDDIPF